MKPARTSPATITIQGLTVDHVAWLNAQAKLNGCSASAVAKGILIDALAQQCDRERRIVGKT